MQCEAKPRLSSENETTIIKPLISAAIGTIFGFALNRGMVYHPVVIREQFIGQNFTMIKMFLSAVSSSLLVNSIMSLVPSLKTNFDKSREKYYKGLLPPSKILMGSVLLGIGMAVSGACPGTVAAQVGAGLSESMFTVIGALVGGIIFMFSETALDSPSSPDSTATLEKKWNIPYAAVALPFVGVLSSFVYLLEKMRPWTFENNVALSVAGMTAAAPFSFSNPIWPPYIAGALIGCLQFFNVQLLSHNIGCSSSYMFLIAQGAYNILPERLHKQIHMTLQKRSGPSNLVQPTFVAGAILGSFLAGRAILLSSTLLVSPLRSFLGGAVLLFGARVANGCTSGHGISGFSNLSWRSFIAVGGMFTGGLMAGLGLKAMGLF